MQFENLVCTTHSQFTTTFIITFATVTNEAESLAEEFVLYQNKSLNGANLLPPSSKTKTLVFPNVHESYFPPLFKNLHYSNFPKSPSWYSCANLVIP